MEHLLDLGVVGSIRDLTDIESGDNFAAKLLQVFSHQSELVTRGIEVASAEGDLVQVRHLAHRLKGSAANIGAKQLSLQAELIERMVQPGKGDPEGLSRAVQDLMPLTRDTIRVLSTLLN